MLNKIKTCPFCKGKLLPDGQIGRAFKLVCERCKAKIVTIPVKGDKE